MTFLSRMMQNRTTRVVLSQRRSSFGNQELDNLGVSATSRIVEWRAALGRSAIQVGTAANQQFYNFLITLDGRTVQRAETSLILDIDLQRLWQQARLVGVDYNLR